MAATDARDNTSDYGSDLDDATAFDILSQAESQPLKNVVLEDIEEPCIKNESLDHRATLRLSRLQESSQSKQQITSRAEAIASQIWTREASVEVEYDESNRNSFSRASAPPRSAR